MESTGLLRATGSKDGLMTEERVRAERTAEAMTPDHVTWLWEAFRSGRPVDCPKDEDLLAVAVDGSAGAYRLVCVRCGHATPWFESKLGEPLRLRDRTLL